MDPAHMEVVLDTLHNVTNWMDTQVVAHSVGFMEDKAYFLEVLDLEADIQVEFDSPHGTPRDLHKVLNAARLYYVPIFPLDQLIAFQPDHLRPLA